MTETKVSRQAHFEPDMAPFGPACSYVRYVVRICGVSVWGHRYCIGHTVRTVTARIIAAAITKIAPEKRAIRGIFCLRPILTFQRRGRGMERR